MFDETFWVGVGFLVFVALIAKPVGRLIAGSLDKHSADIQIELDEALRLKEKAQEVLAAYEREQRNATEEIEKIMAFAKGESERIAREEQEKLKQQLQKRHDLAVEKIAQAESNVIKELRDNASDITVSAARVLISEYLTKEAAENLIEQSLFDIDHKFH